MDFVNFLHACVVKRHGFHFWDSVSLEVQSRSSLPLTIPGRCCLWYLDLKRRFSPYPSADTALPDDDDVAAAAAAAAPSSSDDKVVHIPWLEELRKLCVAELQQEVQRYDVSILSLQLKVKKLKEERKESLREKHQNQIWPRIPKAIDQLKTKGMPGRSQTAERLLQEKDLLVKAERLWLWLELEGGDLAASLGRNGVEKLKGKSVLEGELLADPELLASFAEKLEEEMVP